MTLTIMFDVSLFRQISFIGVGFVCKGCCYGIYNYTYTLHTCPFVLVHEQYSIIVISNQNSVTFIFYKRAK